MLLLNQRKMFGRNKKFFYLFFVIYFFEILNNKIKSSSLKEDEEYLYTLTKIVCKQSRFNFGTQVRKVLKL